MEMMENNQIIPSSEGSMQLFLAMLGEDNMSSNYFMNEIPQEPMAGVPDVQNDDEFCKMALAMSPHDSQPQAEEFTKSDIEMLQDIIRGDLPMETGSVQGMEYLCPDSSPHMYDSNQVFTQQHVQEEGAQAVPVENPTVMISGVIPQPISVDQSLHQQEASNVSSMSVDPPVGSPIDVAEKPPATEDVESGSEGEMPKASKMEEAPSLPDYKELLIRIRYRSQEVIREHIKNPYGCLVYFSKPFVNNPGNPCPAGVEFPEITAEQKSAMTESQFKFTEQVLKALEKGLFLRCDNYGNIYATRFCRSKIFWCSTEKGPIADAQMSNLTLQKLERNEEVMVFDNCLFQQRLLHYVVNKPTFQHEASKRPPNIHVIPVSPAVFFTFAQSWNPMNSALSSCLVSMVVNPVRARMQRQWGNEDRHESYDVSNYRLQISSNEPGDKS